MLSKLFRGIRSLFVRALQERASPVEVGLSVALGVFCSATPFIGFHLWMALGLSTLLRLNRIWAMLGSRATTMPILPVVVFMEVELAHHVRTGGWAPITPHEALAHAGEYLLDWVLGTPLVGGVYAAAVGGAAYALARWRQQRLTTRRPGEPLPASSGSLPSTPPTPMP
jgi:uncharacterized protein (DUF2062 family)